MAPFDISRDAAVAHLQFNRPDAYNSMNMAFWRQFPQAIAELGADPSVRVLVISGQGKHFCAGMDLEVFTGGGFDRGGEAGRRNEHMRQTVLQLQDCFSALERLRFPVLAAIQGGCIGGALDLVSACDCRYASEDAFFTIEEVKLGITADLGTLQRLPHILPQGLVRELAYTGRRLLAAEALQQGLVNRVFTDQQALLDGVLELAQQMAEHSPLAQAGSKEMLNYSRDHGVADSLRYMATWQSGMLQPETDLLEGASARLQKRQPSFADLRPQGSKFSDAEE